MAFQHPTATWVDLQAGDNGWCAIAAEGWFSHSANGIDWTDVALPDHGISGATWVKIRWNGSLYLALCSQQKCATSSDGVNWTLRTITGSTSFFTDAAWNGSVFCAIGSVRIPGVGCYYPTAYYSADGASWTSATLPTTTSCWDKIAALDGLFLILPNGADASTHYATSPDGSAWTARTMSASETWSALRASASQFLARAGQSESYTSGDGISWDYALESLTYYNYATLTHNGTLWHTQSSNGGSIYAYTSTDGLDWTQITTETHASTVSLAAGRASDGLLVRAFSDGSTEYSDDSGATWQTEAPAETVYGSASAPITVRVRGYGAATAPTEITVGSATGQASAPITISVRGYGAATAPVRVGVIDDWKATTWSLLLTQDGADVTARLVGAVRVDAEEGASRIATFTLLPPSGAIDPTTWTSQPVTLDFVRLIAGVSVPTRVFTGRVDEVTYDPITRLARFNCTDDLRNLINALTPAQIDTLTGGKYSAGVQGAIDLPWSYATALMRSVAGSLDAGPAGNPRVTAWDDLPTWATFDSADVIDGSLRIDLPRRADLVNRIEIAYEYRYSRLRERRASIAWTGTAIGIGPLAHGYQYPPLNAIQSAIESTGWTILTQASNAAPSLIAASKPAGAPDGADADWHHVVAAGTISNYSARIAQRHAQTVTETYSAVVEAPTSTAVNGTITGTLRGTLASTWSAAEWESDLTTSPDVSGGDLDHAPDAPRADSDLALETLLDIARVQILASHRRTRARFSIPAYPEMDLDRAVELDTDILAATGKVYQVAHVFDTASGAAITEVAIALSGVAATGTVTSDPLTPPAEPDIDAVLPEDDWIGGLPSLDTHYGASIFGHAYSDALTGLIINAPAALTYYNPTLDTYFSAANPYYDAGQAWSVTGYRVILPGVASDHRNPAALATSASYQLAIPVDPLTLTV